MNAVGAVHVDEGDLKMKFLTLLLTLLGLISWTESRAAIVLASYGAFDEGGDRQALYTLEASSAQKGFGDFELTSMNHSDGQTVNDSLELIYRGIGFDFEPFRLNLDIGYISSLDKFVVDEFDYGVSRSIVGMGLSIDLNFLELHGYSRSYTPSASVKTRIDSFTLSFNPYAYQQSQVGLAMRLGFLEVQADVGRFDRLRGRYDILGEDFKVTVPSISYSKAALLFKGSKHSVLRLEVHKILDDQNQRDNFQKLIGTAVQRDAYDGGSLGIGFSF